MKPGGIVARVGALVPDQVGWALGHRYARHALFCYLRQTYGSRFQPQDPGPVPPPELITTEALMHRDLLRAKCRPAHYFGSGYRSVWTVLTMLERYAFDLRAMRSVLEFGCGSARVLRHFRCISGLELTGTDANPAPIEWNRRNIRGIEFKMNALEPPLAFRDGSFDLVCALSVFTHIPLHLQRPWLDDLARVLRPAGHLLCTVAGAAYLSSQLNEEDRSRLGREGAITFAADHPRASYSSQVLGSWDIFQTRDEVRRVFGQGFDLLCYTQWEGQDMLILRKPA